MYYLFVSKMNYYYENLFEKILLIRFSRRLMFWIMSTSRSCVGVV